MPQRVVDGLSQTVLRQHRVHGIVEPGLELGAQRDCSLLSRPQPLLIGEAFDLPLDAKERLVEREGLVRPGLFSRSAASTKRLRASLASNASALESENLLNQALPIRQCQH